MFSLIISIISIALVVILAGASLYYGGDAFNKGGAKGEAAQFANEGQQISAAMTMFKSDNGGTYPTSDADIAPEYLKSFPEGFVATYGGTDVNGDPVITATKTVSSAEVCLLVADQPGTDVTDEATCATAVNVVTLAL
jgi:type II secretory pathway pseudopilin PulG